MPKFSNYISLSKKSIKALAIFTLLACGPGLVDYDEFISYFMPESTNARRSDLKYSYSSQFFYDEYTDVDAYERQGDTVDHDEALHLEAWSKYVKGKVSKKAISASLYEKGLGLQQYLQSKQNNEALLYLEKIKAINEAYKDVTVDYFTETKVDTVALANLFQEIKQVIPTVKDEFIKERYGFQLVKLAMLNHAPDEAIQGYDQYIEPLKKKSYLSYWALSRKAGALLAKGDSVQAFYHFAQVFDQCPSRRNQADLSIRIYGLGFQEEALTYAKTNHEKAAVYAFAAIREHNEGLTFLEKMVELDPKNPLIELVMSREINKNEFSFYTQNSYWGEAPDANAAKEAQEKAGSYWEKLRSFALSCSQNSQLSDKGFWLAALSYLSYVEKDFPQSAAYLAEAKLVAKPSTSLQQQLKIQELLLLTNQAETVDSTLEQNLVPVLQAFAKPHNFRMSNALNEASKQLIARYYGRKIVEEKAKTGWFASCSGEKNKVRKVQVPFAKAKAYLMATLASYQVNSSFEYAGFNSQVDMYAIEDTTAAETIEQVISYFHQTNKSPFDTLLQGMTGFSDEHLYVLLGRRALTAHQYAKAADAFAKVPTTTWTKDPWQGNFRYNPFVLTTNNKNVRYTGTPLDFAQTMTAMAKRLADNPSDFEAAYTLGCGAYNMSYQGNAWILCKRARSSAEVNTYEEKNFEIDYYQANKAKGYFEIALKSPDKELAAKACFGAAACEEAQFFVYASTQGGEEDYEAMERRIKQEKIRNYSHYFTLLRSEFAKTQYQKQALRECADYHLFASRK